MWVPGQGTQFWRQARWWGRQWSRVPERWRHRAYAGLAGGLLAAIMLRLAGW